MFTFPPANVISNPAGAAGSGGSSGFCEAVMVTRYVAGRPSCATSGEKLALAAGESHAFPYTFPISTAGAPKTVRVRLLFRASPPYFLRALGVPGLVDGLEVNEMAHLELAVPP